MADVELIKGITELPIELIEADEDSRLRPATEAGCETILQSLDELGRIVAPLHVRKIGDRYVLLDGMHRLAVARMEGIHTVPVRVYRCNDQQAQLMEIDGNIAGAELTPLDTAVFLAARKRVYEKMHPETKRGAAGLAAINGQTDTMSVRSFVKTTAKKFGLSERHVRRLVSAGLSLDQKDLGKLRSAPEQVTLKDLMEISQIEQSGERHNVCIMLAEGSAKSASEARHKYAIATGAAENAEPEDPETAELNALLKAWSRTRKSARKRFMNEAGEDLVALMVELKEERDRGE